MKRNMYAYWFIRSLCYHAFVLSILVIPAYSVSTHAAVSSLPKLEALINTSMKQKKIPGMAVAVVSKGKIIFMKAFGLRRVGLPQSINLETLFQLGSTSKAIAATLVAVLQKERVLNLDQPLDLIPGTTLRHILSHTTGVPSTGFNALIERGGSPLEALEKIKELTLEDTPGTKFIYHNVVYNLLTTVLEAQTGYSFESLLEVKLFKPLHMNRTFSTWSEFMDEENRASAHVLKRANRKRKNKYAKKTYLPVPYRKDYTNFPAAGGMSSNIQDMAQFLKAIMGAQPDIISRQEIREFTSPIIHTPDQWHRTRKHRNRITKTEYGLGWRHMTFANQEVVFHGGWIRGFSTILAFLPKQEVGIIVLQNAESSLPFNIAMQFFDWILELPLKKWIH